MNQLRPGNCARKRSGLSIMTFSKGEEKNIRLDDKKDGSWAILFYGDRWSESARKNKEWRPTRGSPAHEKWELARKE